MFGCDVRIAIKQSWVSLWGPNAICSEHFFSCRGKQKQEDTKIAAFMNKRSESCTGSWSHSDWWEGCRCSFSVIPSHVSGLMCVAVFIYFKFESVDVILCMLAATAGPSTGLRCFGIRWSICSDFYSIFALESSILSLRGGGIIIEVILHIWSFIHIYRGVKLDFCSYFFIINIWNNYRQAGTNKEVKRIKIQNTLVIKAKWGSLFGLFY